MNGLIQSLLLSLGLTLVFEVAFFFSVGKRNRRDLLLLVLVNIITNPLVVLLFWLNSYYTRWNVVLVTAVLELLAFAAEGVYYKRYGQDFRRPFLFSLAANAVSYGLGLVLQFII
ncbi:MAG: hypothetical protein FWF10_07420 [Clostridiales bacterium]|nr:hypothetical protein [Clostridiales bacterium]